jgi:hypothetical protein
MYVVGTTEDHNSAHAINMIESMANRGYVAVSVNYYNSTFGDCGTIGGRAKCMFDASNSSSAVSRLCGRSNASGWVMASHGQVEDGEADHCYMRVGGCVSTLDNYWLHGNYDWSRDPNLDWLTGFTLP